MKNFQTEREALFHALRAGEADLLLLLAVGLLLINVIQGRRIT